MTEYAYGTVLEIQRMSTEDGPGIRTTVFMKGCPLQCVWCHNPEGISLKPHIQWIDSRCIGCKLCITVCPRGCLLSGHGIVIDKLKCIGCASCAEVCPSTAIELLGKRYDADILAQELMKDSSYFSVSGGGVTVSGGECTMQSHFVKEVLAKLKQHDIHTAFDTCGICSQHALDMLLPYTDLVLYDIKEMDERRHILYTGQSNHSILKNLSYIIDYMKHHIYPRELWVRTPLIPGRTARDENIAAIAHYINSLNTKTIVRWDLCAFNNLCKDKYTRLGLHWELENTPLLTQEELMHYEAVAKQELRNPAIAKASGTTRIGQQDVQTAKQRRESGC